MTDSLKLSEEARADWHKEQQRVKDEQEWRIKLTVDEWMKDEGTVEVELLEAIKEVSGDMALLIALSTMHLTNGCNLSSKIKRDEAIGLLLDQIRKQMRGKAEEHLYG